MSLTQIGDLHYTRDLTCERLEQETVQNPQHLVEDFLMEAGADNVKVYEGSTRIAGATVCFKVFEPDQLSDDVPIHIRNGFFGAGPAYFGLATALAQRGRRTVVTECVRSQLGKGMLSPDVLRLQAQAGYAAIKHTGAIFGVRQADIIGHSLGGPTTTLLALKHPEAVRSISYTGPAGQDGKNNIRYRLKSAAGVAKSEVVPNVVSLRQEYDPERSMIIDALGYGSRIVRTAREAVAAARINDKNRVIRLHNLGIPLGLVAMENDGFFKPDDIIAHMDDTDQPAHDVIRIIKNGLHIDPNINPNEHAEVQLDMFGRLNRHTTMWLGVG